MKRLKQGCPVGSFAFMVALLGILVLPHHLPLGPAILGLAFRPQPELAVATRSLTQAVPDMTFRAITTGFLTIPVLYGGILFGAAGAIAGGIIGDSLTDAIAGFIEGHVAAWLRAQGFEESRKPMTCALGNMAGCLLGSGVRVRREVARHPSSSLCS